MSIRESFFDSNPAGDFAENRFERSRAKAPEQASATGFYAKYGKRAFDVVGSAALLILLSPIMLVVALLVALQGRPIFFGHRRVGRDGASFACLKFRTMVPDSEQRLQELLARDPEARREWEADHKLSNDPRITRIGSTLRRTSLDELPQLLNVLRGDMSLVGPRPVTAAELERYGSRASSYLAVRPGVTGPWQVSGRNNISYDQRVRIDDAYVSDLSFRRDIKILLKTVTVVFTADGK